MSVVTPEILSRLDGVKRNGTGWTARCPAHDDHRNSLSVSLGDDGRTLLHCHAGCVIGDICTALNITTRDLFADDGNGRASTPSAEWKSVAEYIYNDAHGNPVSKVIRTAGKQFPQYRADGKGGWIKGLGSTGRVLYRLPELLAEPNELVFIVEGEKDCNRLAELGLVATCNVSGAGKWRDEYSEHLEGRRVVIIPDNDVTGKNHARQVARSLHSKASEVKVLELPGLPDKGDVSDWLDALPENVDVTDRLVELVDRCPVWQPNSVPQNSVEQTTIDADELILTELRIAERVVVRHGDRLRFNHQYGWLTWTGSHWRRDDMGTAQTLVKDTVRSAYADLANIDDTEQRRKIFKRLQSFEYANRIKGVLTLSESEPAIRVASDELDVAPHLFNCTNGTLDLRTGHFRGHRQTNLITKCAGAEYDPTKAAPRWKTFLREIFADDVELIDFTQRAVGYSLTGDASEQCLFLLHGTGSNGKSTMLAVLQELLGDYSAQASAETFMAKRSETARNDIARLAGVRFVASIETEDNRRLAESLVKQLTGGDRICARYLFREYFEFVPQFKLWLAANHKPTIRGTDYAVWRRIHLIPFNVKFEASEQDKGLAAVLTGELSGVLNWAIKGCREWMRSGLEPPRAVADATAEYRDEQDTVGAFIAERCITEPAARVSSKDLWEGYKRWSGIEITHQWFNTQMKERGLTLSGRSTGGRRFWEGIGILCDGGTDSDAK